jgi:hypothetical protein
MTALSIALILLGIFLLASTEFGTATILSYRVTRALINGKRGKPVRTVKEWDTYCLQIGVKAAAIEKTTQTGGNGVRARCPRLLGY